MISNTAQVSLLDCRLISIVNFFKTPTGYNIFWRPENDWEYLWPSVWELHGRQLMCFVEQRMSRTTGEHHFTTLHESCTKWSTFNVYRRCTLRSSTCPSIRRGTAMEKIIGSAPIEPTCMSETSETVMLTSLTSSLEDACNAWALIDGIKPYIKSCATVDDDLWHTAMPVEIWGWWTWWDPGEPWWTLIAWHFFWYIGNHWYLCYSLLFYMIIVYMSTYDYAHMCIYIYVIFHGVQLFVLRDHVIW